MKTINDRIEDISGAVDAITGFNIASYKELSGNARTQDAVMFNLIIFAEAANRLGEVFHEAHPEIP